MHGNICQELSNGTHDLCSLRNLHMRIIDVSYFLWLSEIIYVMFDYTKRRTEKVSVEMYECTKCSLTMQCTSSLCKSVGNLHKSCISSHLNAKILLISNFISISKYMSQNIKVLLGMAKHFKCHPNRNWQRFNKNVSTES